MSIAGFELADWDVFGFRSVAIGAMLCSLMSGDPVLAFQAKPEAPPVLDAKSQKIEDLVTAAKSKDGKPQLGRGDAGLYCRIAGR
jgi:hypothetical protein